MKRSSLALLTSLFFTPGAAYAQSVARVKQIATPRPIIATEVPDEMTLAARSLMAIQRLEKDVLVYRSAGAFEESGKLARVSYQAFRKHLNEITDEVEPMLSRLPEGRLKTELCNALASYQDGEYWWQKIDQPRVVHVSAFTSTPGSRTLSETAFADTIPYTITIHWRQANRYSKRAEQLINGARNGAPASLSAVRAQPAGMQSQIQTPLN